MFAIALTLGTILAFNSYTTNLTFIHCSNVADVISEYIR